MAFVDITQRELLLKIVYYGPPLAGKTTNLRALHALAPDGQAGRLMSLEPQGDGTLFYNLLPIRLESKSGVTIKLKILTVPAQPIHRSTRRIILKDADGVVFVADSQKEATDANKESFSDLRANLTHLNSLRKIALVLQFNKQDLPFIRTPEELTKFGQRVSSPVILAQAKTGVGVVETLRTVLSRAWNTLDAQYDLTGQLGWDREDYESALCWDWREPHMLSEAVL